MKYVSIISFLLLAGSAEGQIEIDSLLIKLESISVMPENRCSEYSRLDYYYPSAIEHQIAERDGMVSRYSKRVFRNLEESRIEHVVALSEAHDSGLCGVANEIRGKFASDLDNLVLVFPTTNGSKAEKDAGQWIPDHNKCWFGETVIKVKKKYNLSIDQQEKDALKQLLKECSDPAPVKRRKEATVKSSPCSDKSDSEIKSILISRSLASYSGSCPCPYNTDRAGRRCGRRSAYSRPGGASPLCYKSDVTETMVENYRKSCR